MIMGNKPGYSVWPHSVRPLRRLAGGRAPSDPRHKPRSGSVRGWGNPKVPPVGPSPVALPMAADHRRSMPVGFAAESAE